MAQYPPPLSSVPYAGPHVISGGAAWRSVAVLLYLIGLITAPPSAFVAFQTARGASESISGLSQVPNMPGVYRRGPVPMSEMERLQKRLWMSTAQAGAWTLVMIGSIFGLARVGFGRWLLLVGLAGLVVHDSINLVNNMTGMMSSPMPPWSPEGRMTWWVRFITGFLRSHIYTAICLVVLTRRAAVQG